MARLTFILLTLASCSPRSDGAPAGAPTTAVPASGSFEDLIIVGPAVGPHPAARPLHFRLESKPMVPEGQAVEWRFSEGERILRVTGKGPTLDHAVPEAGRFAVTAHVGTALSKPVEVAIYRVALVDGGGAVVPEARPALLGAEAFDAQGRLKPEAVAKAAERIAVQVDDPLPGAGASVTLGIGPARATLTLPLSGPAERRVTRSIVLLADRLDAEAAGSEASWARPGDRIELQYRGTSVGTIAVGPSAIHSIPVRVVAAGPGLPPAEELRKALELRLAQANEIWEPFGRRFVARELLRLETLDGWILIRGRASGVGRDGKPSRLGVTLDGRAISLSTAWKDRGTPETTARSFIAAAGDAFRIERYEGLLAGDPAAIALRVRHPDGSPAKVAALPEGEDSTQSFGPPSGPPADGCEVSPSPGRMTSEELLLLGSARTDAADGIDLVLVGELRAFQSRPAYKAYAGGRFAGSAIVSWGILDASGRFPYALARVFGLILMPPGSPPRPEDTLFSDPLSEVPGVNGHKRLTAATALKISERGRGLTGLK